MKIFANFYEIHFIIIKIFSHVRTILNLRKTRGEVMTSSQNHLILSIPVWVQTNRGKDCFWGQKADDHINENVFSRSSMISSALSMPTDILINPSVIPAFLRSCFE